MRKTGFLNRYTAILFLVLCGFSASVSADVTYCAPSAFGYSTATGGGSATPVLVSSVSELQAAIGSKAKNKVVIITKNLTFTNLVTLKQGQNITILGLPGVKLISAEQTATTSGILYFRSFDNLIIRNLTFEGPGAYDCDGSDLLCFEKVTNAWVDHCDFQDGCDGNFDSKATTDNVTVSWCRFRYLKAPKAGGSGGSDDHRYTNLLGKGATDKPDDGWYSFTWAYCWWDDGCKERMIRCRNAELHFLNCYWNSSVANYYVGPENAKAYFEGCTFEGKANTKDKIFKSYGGTNACKFVDCSGNLPGNSGSVSAPSYSYTASGRDEAKTAVTNATCGAGATLTVTTAGAVSSSCDGGAPLPTVYTVTWDAATNSGSCGTASTQVTDGAAIGTLPDATKEGYNFDGWYTLPSGGTKINSTTTVTGNVTYYAQFTSAPVTVYYTVIWDANGGTCATASSTIESGQTIGTLPDATKAGDYTFDGWYTAINGGTKILTTTTVSSNVTYYAHYTATGGGGGGDCSYTYAFAKESDATTAGVTNSPGLFSGFGTTSSGNDCTGSITIGSATYSVTKRASNTTVSISFTVPTDKVGTLYGLANSGGSSVRTLTLSDGDSYSETQSTSNSSSAAAAITFSNLPAATYTLSSTQNVSVPFLCLELCDEGGSTPPPASYTLSYDENGGKGEPMEDQVGTSLTVAANTYTLSGYAFQNWSTSRNGGGVDYAAGDPITLTEDVTLYAIWQAQSYTVTFDKQSGDGGSASVTATFDESMPDITVPSRAGYIFKGYYSEEDGGGTQYYDENGSSTNAWNKPTATTLYAYWEAGSITPVSSDLHFWFFKAADATANGKTNDATMFADMVSDASNMAGSITIDGTSYSVTRRTGDHATFGSFTIPSGYTGIFYALAVSSGGGDRQINLVGATQTYELDVPGGSDSYKRLESEELPAGTYSIERDGTSNVRLSVVIVKLITALPPSAAPTISDQPDGATYNVGDPIAALSVTATGSGTLTYQWKKDGVNIYGATTENYTPSESGVYTCVVTNTEDGKSPTSLTSEEAEITIIDPSVKECVVLVSYTLSSSGTATPSIPADEDNLVGGAADYKVSSTSTGGGYKLNSDQYFGLSLASGKFKAGDKVTVTITKASDTGDKGLHLSTSKTGAAVASIATGDVVVGDNEFTLTADCDAVYVARNSSVSQNPYVKAISVCRELTQYTVTFDKNNASATGTMSAQSFYAGYASKLTANSFKLTDYVFAGWATDPSGSKVYDDKQSVTMTGDITLYAIWEPAKYTLTNAVSPAGYGTVDVASVDEILPGAATTSSANTYTVQGITVTATPTATSAEYTYAFDSWSGLPATVTEDATVTAVFTRTARDYTVTLYTNGGTIQSGDVTGYTFGIGATLPTDVTKAGAEFGGWYDNSGLSGSAVTEITTTDTGDKEYWAKWTTCPAVNSGEVVYKFAVKSSMTSGNVCATTNTDYPMTTSNSLSELTGGTLTARASNTNRLKYASGAFTFQNGDGGVLRVDLDCPIASGDVIRFINSATGNGYNAYVRHTSSSTSADQITLAEKNPTVTTIAIPDAFDGETTLYIVRGANTNALISYFEIVRACAITLDAHTNGGTVEGEDTKAMHGAMGDVFALPHAFKDGSLFKGWYDAASGGSPVSDPYTVAGTITLYAQFDDCPHGGTLYKFEVGTGLTNGAVTANNVPFEFTTANDLSSIVGGTLTTAGSAASKVTISGTNAISITDNNAYLKIDLDCEIQAGDVIKTTLTGNTLYINNTTSRTTDYKLDKGDLLQTPIPAALVGAKTLYLWKGGGNDNALTYFEITRLQQTHITLTATDAYNHYTSSVVALYDNAMPEVDVLPMRTGYVFGGYYDAPNGGGTQYYDGLGESVHNWDKDVVSATLYAYWVEPCNMAPTLKPVIPVVSIWDDKRVDLSLIQIISNVDGSGVEYTLASASENIPGCDFIYLDDRIFIQGTPNVGNTSTVTRTITFTVTNDCSPASTYDVTATIRIYPAGQRAKVAYIIRGTQGGAFNAWNTSDSTSSADLLAYLKGFYDVRCVNGYATKNEADLATYYNNYDLLIVTDYMETPEGYTNAIGTLIDKKPILSFEAYVANQSNWHIGSNPKDPSPKVQDMKVLCAGHAIFKNAKYNPSDASETVVVNPSDTSVHVLSSLSGNKEAKGLQGFTINEAPDFIFLATVRDANNQRDLIVCCERQVVFPARLLLYGINFYEMPNLSNAGKIIMRQMIDYLLMTEETKVADCSLVFDNNSGDHRWSNPANWAPGYNIIPTPYHPARIIAECHVDEDDAHAGSVKVNKGKDKDGNPVDGKLIVKPNGGLTIAGLVATVNDTRYASPITIKAEDLLIESDASHNGAFVYGNKESDVRATVQYYSRGTGAYSEKPEWQYMGIPFQAGHTALEMYSQAWMCRWESAGTLGGLWQWVNYNDVLEPFEGYCISQEASKTYTFSGKLNAPVTQTLHLDNCDADGFAFAANSWTAPIKIQEMKDDDFVNAERTIYIYHSGSYAQWDTNKETIINTDESGDTPSPGQYVVIPIHSSPYLGADSVIPAMQGFFVKTSGAGATLSLVYNRVVYDATYFKTSTQPMRAPRSLNTADEPEVMVLNVIGNSYGDRVHLLSRGDFSDEFEDGWDGRKLEGDTAAPYLAVVKEAGEMAVASIAEYEGRNLLFRAGEDIEYTFTFHYLGDDIYLYDRVTEQATLIRTGNTYTFSAVNKAPENRFLITANPPRTPTELNNVQGDNIPSATAQKFIYEGKLLIYYRGVIYDALGAPVKTGKEGAQ